MIQRLLPAFVAIAGAAVGCKCVYTPVCQKISAEYIFTGRVEAQDTEYVQAAQRLAERSEELGRLVDGKSEVDLAGLRAIVGTILPEPFAGQVRRAVTFEQFEKAVGDWAERGMWFRFRVFEAFKGPEQSYLVYAGRDETGRIEPVTCFETRPLSRAGEELACWHMRKHGGEASGRVFGFVTRNSKDEKDLVFGRDRSSDPIRDTRVTLESRTVLREAETDKEGRFLFDSLQPGEYSLRIPGQAVPARVVTLSRGACRQEIFFVPRP